MSETLARKFSSPLIVDHQGGHYLACTGSLKDHYKDFFRDMKDDLIDLREMESADPESS